MRSKLIPAVALVGLVAAMIFGAGRGAGAQAAVMKIESILLWGTDDTQPPEGKDYKPISPDVAEKLKGLGLKWTHWFEVRRVITLVPPGETKVAHVSDKCQVKITNLDNKDVEVCLIGKGKEVMKRKQALPKKEMLFLGGNAPNSTAWLVGLKRLE